MAGRIIGNYQITDELSHGSLGAVYRGHHLNLPRDVVVKEVSLNHFPVSTRVQLKARFRRETFIQAQLDHPGIVRIYESFSKGDNYYLVVEYVPGVSLRDLLLRQGLPTSAQALYLCKQALSALDYAHNFQYLTESDVQSRAVLHRDLKPANLLIDGRGKLKITDFGIVKMPDKQSMAPPSFRPGTSEYMPPEQLRGLDLDARSDIYSLGVTFYEMLTGQLPFLRSTRNPEDDQQIGVLDSGPKPISEIRSDIHLSLSSIFMRAIIRNSSERFQTAAEFLKAIKEYERSSGATEIPSGPLVARLAAERPEAAAIIEIAAKPDKQPLMTPIPLSFQPSISPATTQQVDLTITASREVSSQSLTLHGTSGKNGKVRGLFEYVGDRPRNSRTVVIAVAAVFLVIFAMVYFLMQNQDGAEMTAQKLESGGTANVASAVTTANAATPQPEQSVEPVNTGDIAKLQEAREADRMGKFKQAAALYNEYLRSGPADAEAATVVTQVERLNKFIAYLNSARTAYKRGDYVAARQKYAEALKLRPYSRVAQNGLSRSEARLSGASGAPSSGEERPPQS